MSSNYQNAAALLYLNPELQAFSNVISVEDVRDRFSDFADLPSTLPSLPPTFDEQVYIADNRAVMNISALNRTIYFAMSNEGVDDETMENNSMYLGTIMRDVTLVARNTFEFNDVDELGTFRLNNNTLQPGDDIRIFRPKGTDNIYGRVVAIDPFAYRFTLSNAVGRDIDPVQGSMSNNFTFYGIKLYDYERLTRVSIARQFLADPAGQEYLLLNRDFNKEFHQMLYPNTRLLTQNEAYVDFINRWGAKDYRVANASDLYNASAPLNTIVNLQVRCNLTLGKLIRWNGFTICNFSSNDWSVSDEATDNTLITDRAIKTYVDRPYRTTATFNRFLACNNALFTADVNFSSNVHISPDATEMRRDVTMRSNLTVNGYVNCSTTTQTIQLLAISRIGIGSDGASVILDDVAMNVPPPGGGSGIIGGGSTSNGGGGGVIIGGSSSNDTLYISDQINFANEYTMKVNSFSSSLRLYPADPDSTASHTVLDANGNVGIGMDAMQHVVPYKLYVAGDVYSTGVLITQSDARRKNDVHYLDADDALARVLQLKGCTYEITQEPKTRRHLGLIAQDVLKTVPEAVYTDDQGYHSIAYGNLMGVVIEGLRAVNDRLTRVESHLALPQS
jgi:hypothetical protein